MLTEAKALYPQIHSCAYSETIEYNATGEQEKMIVVRFTSKGKVLYNSDKAKINRWLASRLGTERFTAYFD